MKTPEALYAAFDTYPAAKGATVHIREFSTTLFNAVGSGRLLVLGNELLQSVQHETNFEIHRLSMVDGNFLQRADRFADFVDFHATVLSKSLKIAHFRDPWGGIPIVRSTPRSCTKIYEVNALPSIELPFRYADLSAATIEKLRMLEKECWENADAIVCPSVVIRDCLISLGADGARIQVIRNGAIIPNPSNEFPKPPEAPDEYFIYFGAVQTWQGIEVLFKAMTLLRDLPRLLLVMIVSGNRQRLKFLDKLAQKQGIADRIVWHFQLSQEALMPWVAGAEFSVAPLTECTRNLVQGCCPLKIVESMAVGVPVIASDLPVARELIEHNRDGWLVRADRPSELARAIRILHSNHVDRKRLGDTAKERAREHFSWEKSNAELAALYRRFT